MIIGSQAVVFCSAGLSVPTAVTVPAPIYLAPASAPMITRRNFICQRYERVNVTRCLEVIAVKANVGDALSARVLPLTYQHLGHFNGVSEERCPQKSPIC